MLKLEVANEFNELVESAAKLSTNVVSIKIPYAVYNNDLDQALWNCEFVEFSEVELALSGSISLICFDSSDITCLKKISFHNEGLIWDVIHSYIYK